MESFFGVLGMCGCGLRLRPTRSRGLGLGFRGYARGFQNPEVEEIVGLTKQGHPGTDPR